MRMDVCRDIILIGVNKEHNLSIPLYLLNSTKKDKKDDN